MWHAISIHNVCALDATDEYCPDHYLVGYLSDGCNASLLKRVICVLIASTSYLFYRIPANALPPSKLQAGRHSAD